MIQFYIAAVQYGYMTIDDVPQIYREDVEAALAA